jgi:hypothetical protein
VAFTISTQTEYALKITKGSKVTSFDAAAGNVAAFSAPSINNGNTAVFFGRLDDGTVGIFTINQRRLEPIATLSNGFSGFFFFPSINSSGSVVFAARLPGGGSGVFTGDGTSINTIADTTGAFASFDIGGWDAIGPAINDNGAVAFAAILDDGRQGIFVGPDPIADKVIASGDPLFGSTVSEVYFGRYGLNNSGQLVFRAVLTDGTEGIYRADMVRPNRRCKGSNC